MDLKWNLQDIFNDNKAFYDEIELTKKSINDIKKNEVKELDSDVLLELLDKKWKIKEASNNILIYGSLIYYKNINDKTCIELKKIAEKFNNEVDTLLKFVDRKIIEIGLDKVFGFINSNPKLESYRFYLNNLFRLEEHSLSVEENDRLKHNNDLINEQLSTYNNLLRDIEYGVVYIDGEEIKITASNYAKYISSRDRDTRKKTYFSVNESFEKEKNNFVNILNKIYSFRLNNSTLEKYSSILEKVLFEENINSKIIENLIESVHNNLHLIQKYLKIKSNLLEIEEPHLYDFGVPLDSNLKIKYSIEEAKEILLNALEPLGNKYIETVKLLFDGHIDAEIDDNKHQSITFSWNTYSFMNYKGAYIDIKNMIHEIGHIVNYYLSKKEQPYIYEDSTIFVGETASIVNEILLNRYLYDNAKTEEEKLFYLSKEIENYFTSVFKQTMYTEFENDLYLYKNNDDLTSEILCNKYSSLIKKYYGNDIIYDDISNIEWTRLGHLYRWSYYPFKYATGLLIASTVVDSLVDKKTLSKDNYIKFLSSGSSQYSLDLLNILNIDLLNTNIIENGFIVLEKDIEKLNKILFLKQ